MIRIIFSQLKIIYPNDDYTSRYMQMMEYDIVCLACTKKIVGYEPADLAQELRARLYGQIRKYDPNRADFRTWGLKVIKNHLKNLNTASKTHKRKANSHVSPLEMQFDE